MPLTDTADHATAADWQRVRLAAQARTDQRTTLALLVIYQLDALLLAGFCLAGAARWSSPLAFSVCGLLVSGGAVLANRCSGGLALDDTRIVRWQVLAALALVLAVGWTDPVLTVPMLLTAVCVVATAALRMTPRWLLPLCAITAAASTALAVAHGGQLQIPVDGLAQQTLTGLFLLWTLAKAVSIHMAGMAMRMEIDASHARLAVALERVRQLAEVDEQTGVANRRRVLAALAAERDRSLRTGIGFAVAMLDIDHFKRINDSHGHPAGDAVLQAVAAALRGALRGSDLVGRWGGEEFLVVLPGADTAEAGAQAAERLRLAIAGHAWAEVVAGLQVTASIGVAVSAPGEPVERLLDRADRGLYQAKHAGRNRVAAWPEGALTR